MKKAILRVLSRLAPLCALLASPLAPSCAEPPRGLLSGTSPPPPDVKQACALTATRCSHCHPIERVILMRGVGERKWQMLIEQMRLKPSSGISPGDAEIISRCLRFVDESCTDCQRGRS